MNRALLGGAFAIVMGCSNSSKDTPRPCPEVTPEAAVKVFATDRSGVKAALRSRVRGGRPTVDDVRLLAAVCANDQDEDCLKECQGMLGPPDAGAPSKASDAGLLPDGGKKTVTDTARELVLTDPVLVKSLLWPRVTSGTGNAEDVKILTAACQQLKDKPCLDYLRDK